MKNKRLWSTPEKPPHSERSERWRVSHQQLKDFQENGPTDGRPVKPTALDVWNVNYFDRWDEHKMAVKGYKGYEKLPAWSIPFVWVMQWLDSPYYGSNHRGSPW